MAPLATVQAINPSYVAPYGGSFASPHGASALSPAAIQSAIQAAASNQQPKIVRRMSSQGSQHNLSVQPQIVTTQPITTAAPVQIITTRGTSYVAGIPGQAPVEGIGSLGGAAEMMSAEEQERVLLQTRLLRQGCEGEIIQAEMEQLRRSAVMQEERVGALTKQLQASQENERKLALNLEASHKEANRLREELRLERLTREQAEAANAELRVAAEMATQAAGAAQEKTGWQNNNRSGTPLNRRRQATNEMRQGSATRDSARQNSPLNQPSSRGSPDVDAGRRGSGRLPSGKDEIDGRLMEFLDRDDCGIIFRRLNRGWYSFRRKDEKASIANDRSVEISIVNGKLMVRLEPSTHDNGWNNGKLGTIERFCQSMSA